MSAWAQVLRLLVAATCLLAVCLPTGNAWGYSSTWGDFHAAFWELYGAIRNYHDVHGHWPVTDNESTWFEKLDPATRRTFVYRGWVTPDRRLPADYLKQPLIYVPPAGTNLTRDEIKAQLILRSIGKDGIDQQGKGDDLDSRFGANDGYWFRSGHPAQRRKAVLWSLAAIVAGAFTGWLARRRTWAFRLMCISAVAWLILRYGDAKTGPFFHDLPRDRTAAWIFSAHKPLGVVICVFAGFVGHQRRQQREARQRHDDGCCAHCGYDLRGSVATKHVTCPECGTVQALGHPADGIGLAASKGNSSISGGIGRTADQ